MLKRTSLTLLFIFMMTIENVAFAKDLFATEVGRSIDSSDIGRLLFDFLMLFGMYTCLKVLYKVYRYAKNQQSRISYMECLIMFICGVLLYYPHHTFNLFYNTFI